MTVTRAFQEFKSKLEITKAEQEKAQTRHNNVREKLREKMVLDRDFLSGSYGRNTKIRPLNDVDLMIVLNVDEYADDYYHNGDPTKILKLIKTIVDDLYPRTPSKIQARSVNLDFHDFGFDIVPSFDRSGGGLLIPDSNIGGWMGTSPEAHQRLLTEANKKAGQMLVPLVKMVKSFNLNKKKPLRSFHIEAMSLDIFWEPPASYQEGLIALFSSLATKVLSNCPDPAGMGPGVDDYLDGADRLRISKLLGDSIEKARQALELESQNDHNGAIGVWYSLLGAPFPKPKSTSSAGWVLPATGRRSKVSPDAEDARFA